MIASQLFIRRRSIMKLNRRRMKLAALIATASVIAAVGGLVAHTVARPQAVDLKTHIRICQQTEKGAWEVIDEVGPATLNFEASLLELANGRKASSRFVWQTKTKKGRSYTARLLDQADVDFNPATRQFTADLKFEVTLDGKKATVPGKLTTESLSGPLGAMRGKRAQGLIGRDRTSFTLVSANLFQPAGEPMPLMLVCTEEYKLTPKE
jgi:hypothetical protein